jgi:hypothetical protein
MILSSKCNDKQVYNKHTKRCLLIGSVAYRTALKKDPSVFNNQKNKITKVTNPKSPFVSEESPLPWNVSPFKVNKLSYFKSPSTGSTSASTISPSTVSTISPKKPSPNIPTQPLSASSNNTFSASSKLSTVVLSKSPKAPTKTPSSLMSKIAKIPKKSSVKVPKAKKVPTCSTHEVYNKNTNRCVLISGSTYKAALKKDPSVFNEYAQKIAYWMTTYGPAAKPLKKTVSSNNKAAKISSFMQAYGNPLKAKVVTPLKAKVVTPLKANSAKVVTPLKANSAKAKTVKVRLPPVKVSKRVKELFMKKASKFLRTRDLITLDVLKYTDLSKIPPYVLIKKSTEIRLMYFDYFPRGVSGETVNVSPLTFNHTPKLLNRSVTAIQYSTDNISSHFYRHILQSEKNQDMIDTKWFISMQDYISKLSDRQRYAIYSYTYKGDVYVNRLERGQTIDYNEISLSTIFFEFVHTMSLGVESAGSIFKSYQSDAQFEAFKMIRVWDEQNYNELLNDRSGVKMFVFRNKFIRDMKSVNFRPRFMKMLVEKLADTISGVISGAPPTTKTMVVFRGVKDSFFTANDFSVKPKNEVFKNKGFVSTAINHRTALTQFTSIPAACCFKVITVLPGTRCLPIMGLTAFAGETEILFNRNVKFIIRDKYKADIPRRPKGDLLNNGQPIKMKIAEITVG